MGNDIENNNTRIILRIDESNDARAFETADEIIQVHALKQLFGHIKASMEKADSYVKTLEESNLLKKRFHDTIALFGSRGTGKTTFILNALEQIRTGGKYLEDLKINSCDIEVLAIKDPTLVEAKEHVFVNIISSIKEAVEAHCNINGSSLLRMPQDPCDDFDRCDENLRYQKWLSSLNRLARGLPAIDGIGGETLNRESWHDPIHIMEEGLKTVKASNQLERNFHLYVRDSLELIGKKAFIMAFDDVDTDFKAGWPVLETIRKYLTTPQLIIMLSGDPKLYSKLIRQNQWNCFSGRLLKYENNPAPGNGPKTDFNQIVSQLEDQYLLKILKPQRRLRLKSVLEYIQTKMFVIDVAYGSGDGKQLGKIEDILGENLERVWGITQNSQSSRVRYREFILSEPIRTLVQLFAAFKRAEGDGDSKQPYEKLSETYFSTLYRHGIETELQTWHTNQIMPRISKILLENSLFHQGYKFLPEFQENPANRLMLVLSAFLFEKIKTHPELFFDYMTAIGLPRHIMDKGQGSQELTTQMEKMGLFAAEGLVSRSGYLTGYIQDFMGTMPLLRWNKSGIQIGANDFPSNLFRIYGTRKREDLRKELKKIETEKGEKGFPLWAPFFDTLLPHDKCRDLPEKSRHTFFFIHAEHLVNKSPIKGWHSILAGLPGQYLVTNKNEKRMIWSIHNLLAVIGEILSCTDEVAIKAELLSHAELTEYNTSADLPPQRIEETEETNENEEAFSKEEIDPEDTELKQFSALLFKWKNNYPKNQPLPPYIIARMLARFYQGLYKISEECPKIKTQHLGWLFNRCIIVFLNAVVVEESLYRDPRTGVRPVHPTNKDDIFNKNRSKSTPPFFKWLAKCPLWYPYLDPDSKLYQETKEKKIYEVQYQVDPSEPVRFGNLFPILNVVIPLLPPKGSEAQKGPGPKKQKTYWNHNRWRDLVREIGRAIFKTELQPQNNLETAYQYVVKTYVEPGGYEFRDERSKEKLKKDIENLTGLQE